MADRFNDCKIDLLYRGWDEYSETDSPWILKEVTKERK